MSGTERIYLKDYKKPAFLINHVDLTFELNDETRVTSHLTVVPNPEVSDLVSSLVLDGEKIKLEYIALDGVALTPRGVPSNI